RVAPHLLQPPAAAPPGQRRGRDHPRDRSVVRRQPDGRQAGGNPALAHLPLARPPRRGDHAAARRLAFADARRRLMSLLCPDAFLSPPPIDQAGARALARGPRPARGRPSIPPPPPGPPARPVPP